MVNIPLHIACLLGLTSHWWHPYTGLFPLLWKNIFDEVTNRSDILPGYELKLVCKDTQGIPGLASKRFFELIQEEPAKLALIGPGLSDETSQVGQVTPFFNMLQITVSSRTATISNRKSYSSLYMTNFLEEALNPIRIALMKYFGWRRVGTIYYQEDMFVSQMTRFHSDLEENNFTLLTSSVFSESMQISENIRRIKQYDVRIIMGAFRGTRAPYVFCEAYKQGLYGRRYLWMLSGSQMFRSWIDGAPDDIPCTKEELYIASAGYLSLDHSVLSTSDKPTISGKRPSEFSDFIKNLAKGTGYLVSSLIPWVYDGGWALALALNNSMMFLDEKKLEDFSYNDTDMFNAIAKGIESVEFDGISGPVSFLHDGRRVGIADVSYNINGTMRNVATYDPRTDAITWLEDPNSLFAGGRPPRDRFAYIESYVPASYPAVVCVLFLNIIGCFIAIAFLAFNTAYKKNRHIKMSSPNINNIIIMGCLIMYMSVFVRTLDYMNVFIDIMKDDICMIKMWIGSIGFTTAFGALFSKTWRVHVIFRLDRLHKKVIKDIRLLGLIIIFWMIDVIILTIWSAIHSLKKQELRVPNKNTEGDLVITTIYTHCYHEMQVYWYATMYIYNGLLLIFGTFLAWETRMVQVPALNDSKLIGFCVYNVVVVCAFGVPIGHVLPTQQTTLAFVLISLLTIFCTTLVLCILFIPKLKLRNQTSNMIFVQSMNSGKISTSTSTTTAGQSKQLELSSYSKDELTVCQRPGTGDRGKDNPQCIKEENKRLRMEKAQETIAIAKLKKDILRETGDVHFTKVDDHYQVFRTRQSY